MAAKRFRIATPDQLKELKAMVRVSFNIGPTASVWSAAKRRYGKTNWDERIYACFSGDREKQAYVMRDHRDGTCSTLAVLKYNKALAWCEQNLTPIALS